MPRPSKITVQPYYDPFDDKRKELLIKDVPEDGDLILVEVREAGGLRTTLGLTLTDARAFMAAVNRHLLPSRGE
jgi:hypothetical protein